MKIKELIKRLEEFKEKTKDLDGEDLEVRISYNHIHTAGIQNTKLCDYLINDEVVFLLEVGVI